MIYIPSHGLLKVEACPELGAVENKKEGKRKMDSELVVVASSSSSLAVLSPSSFLTILHLRLLYRNTSKSLW